MKLKSALGSLTLLLALAVPSFAQVTTTPVKVTIETMPYTDAAQNTYPNSVWLCVSTNISKLDHSATSTWYGYPTLSLASQRQTGGVNATIGQHQFTVSGAAFPPWYAPLAAGTASLQTQENSLLSTLDVDSGTKNAQGVEIYTAFFATATQTTITVNVPNQ